MNSALIIALTLVGQEHRLFGLDWSYFVMLGLIGNATFPMRLLVQWIASEKQGESVIPISFWYWSIAWSLIMFWYFLFRRDPVGILPNTIVYLRNLMFIRKRKLAFTAATSSQEPRETN